MRNVMTLLTIAALLLTGCAAGRDSEGDAREVAEQLVEGLEHHSLTGVPLRRDSASARHERLVGPLEDHPVTVELDGLTRSGDDAVATLGWSWQIAGRAWRYRTEATLHRSGSRWEVDWAPSLLEPSLQVGDRLGVFTLPDRRGRILGQGGVPLVEDRPVVRYGVDKTRVGPRRVTSSATRVARILEIDVETFVDRVEAAGPEAFVEAIVLRVEDARDVDPAYAGIPGAVALEDTMPLAPTRDFAAELLGRVGPATAEIIEESEGRVEAGDEVGLSGLQARYDQHLRGSPGVEVVAVDAAQERRRLFRVRPRHGRDLRTTLDLDLQSRAEVTLDALGEDGPPSALVAIRPSTGQVLATANGPGSDGLDLANTGQYAPGSTFKVVTALALLRAGVHPQHPIECPSTIDVDGRSFKNYDDYPADRIGTISFSAAFAHSCNTALIGARELLEGTDLADAAEALGLGRDHDLGFPAYFGQVPPAEGETEMAADLIGQGKVLASPLAMATVVASVRAGRAVVPTLLAQAGVDSADPEHPLTDEETQTLQGLMRAVVTEGSGQFLSDLPGEVGAKTGTAEYGAPGPDGELETHAWMVATRGDLAVAAFVETGQSGSATAGPLLEDFLRSS